jgi:phage shock protein A
MKLMQRVITLIKANINDMIDRAEDPEKMIKQLITDLNNQLIQVKTTVAQSLADQHLLEKKLIHAQNEAAAFQQRAQQAVDKNDDDLARAALARHNSFERTVTETEKQLDEQRRETDALKLALSQLETKIAEVTRQRDVLLARQRRAVAKEKLSQVKSEIHPERLEELLDAVTGYVDRSEARAEAHAELTEHGATHRLARLEEDTRIDQQLAELKAKKSAGSAAA